MDKQLPHLQGGKLREQMVEEEGGHPAQEEGAISQGLPRASQELKDRVGLT